MEDEKDIEGIGGEGEEREGKEEIGGVIEEVKGRGRGRKRREKKR